MNETACVGCQERGLSIAFDQGGVRIVRCERCGLAFLWPRPPASDLHAIYERYYRDDNVALHPLNVESYGRVLSQLEGDEAPGRLLDVGCGGGQFIEAALARGWRAEGTEISPAAMPYLRLKRLTVHNQEITAMEGAAEYDAITFFEVIEHVASPSAHLRAAARLLKPGGLLYLSTPNFDGLSRHVLGSAWRVLAPEHLTYFCPRTMKMALGEAGLEPLRIVTRNLDLADLRLRLCPRSGRGDRVHNNIQETTAFRETVHKRRALRSLKGMANWVLHATNLGDTLEAFARKSSVP